MTAAAETPIAWLARRCAERNLGLRDARALFMALYLSDAISMAGGNISHAAKLAGVGREHLHRRRLIAERASVEPVFRSRRGKDQHGGEA